MYHSPRSDPFLHFVQSPDGNPSLWTGWSRFHLRWAPQTLGATPNSWHRPGQHEGVKQVAQAEHVPSDFVSTFRQRFAPLFGRKIARQRAEQYLGGLLCGKAERRNVTSLAGTVDGATARPLGWLLNKSPWPTRPIVDALQLYVGNTYGTPDGLFTLNIDNFVKRGDNAVGVEQQFVHHQGRTSNSQIGVFLAYGSQSNSALVDAAIYMPHSWIDDAARREKAGVPESLQYKTRSALALDLLGQARTTGHLPGEWVTSWRGEGFEADSEIGWMRTAGATCCPSRPAPRSTAARMLPMRTRTPSCWPHRLARGCNCVESGNQRRALPAERPG